MSHEERDLRKHDERDARKSVLTHPENWDDMVEKYREREQEQLEQALTRRDVNDIEELRKVAREAIRHREVRSGEHTPLKDHKVIVHPKSGDIQALREQLLNEINASVAEIWKQYPNLKTPEGQKKLKGRITIGAPQDKALAN